MKIFEIIKHINEIAPSTYQESYDNAGLITGNPKWECKGAIISLDCIEEVIQEAIDLGYNMVIAHHPILFSGLKSLTGKNYVERTIIKAIKNDIAIFAVHTNLDNVINGVNSKICEKIGLKDLQILAPKSQILHKIYTFVPEKHTDKVRNALFEAGAGSIGNYSECSFNTSGTGTFKGNEKSDAFIGEKGKIHQEKENKIEVIFPHFLQNKIISALVESHPYEEVAYDIMKLENKNKQVGSGMIGNLTNPYEITSFLNMLKKEFNCGVIKHTKLLKTSINRVAVCGGSGSFLLQAAITKKADIFISADYKYHQFFDADNQIVIADIGHYESEQFTSDLLYNYIKEKFRNFALRKSSLNTNPVKYL